MFQEGQKVEKHTAGVGLLKRAFHRRQDALGIVARLQRHPKLPQIVGTFRALCGIPQPLNGRRQETDHNAYNRYNHEQLDQRITRATRDPKAPHCITSSAPANALEFATIPPNATIGHNLRRVNSTLGHD